MRVDRTVSCAGGGLESSAGLCQVARYCFSSDGTIYTLWYWRYYRGCTSTFRTVKYKHYRAWELPLVDPWPVLDRYLSGGSERGDLCWGAASAFHGSRQPATMTYSPR
jgi:hypothetical protein